MRNSKFYLYYPLLFFLVLIGLDKIFTIDFFKDNFLQTGNIVYYKHRPLLFEKLKSDNSNKDLFLAFGDSRAYAYSDIAFETDKERKEKYSIYNFSGPQAVPAYTLYWMEKIVKAGIKPKLIFFIVSPKGFDDSKGLMHSPFLRMGADDDFVIRYWKHIPSDDRQEYILDKLVAFRKLEVNYKLFLERVRKGQLKEYDIRYNTELPLLNISKGAQLAYMSFANDIKRLEEDTLRIKSIYLGSNFKQNETQYFFTEKVLEIAKENKIKVFLVWPRVYKTYRLEYDKLKLKESFGKRMETLASKYDMRFFDLNEVSDCDEFYDASHQSVSCYRKIVNYFVDEYEKAK
ncbi:MAG TPA: DUF1574 domain-containing protein [Leptospiraceae bacterium]|nr:DUF1574 domain-containing protein [Leptospiraceae bacterium]